MRLVHLQGEAATTLLVTPVSPAESDALVQVESPARPLETASTEMLLYNHYEIMTANGLLLGVEHEKYHRRVLSLAQDVQQSNTLHCLYTD